MASTSRIFGVVRLSSGREKSVVVYKILLSGKESARKLYAFSFLSYFLVFNFWK